MKFLFCLLVSCVSGILLIASYNLFNLYGLLLTGFSLISFMLASIYYELVENKNKDCCKNKIDKEN